MNRAAYSIGRSVIALFALAMASIGCANLTVNKIDGHNSYQVPGVRYFLPKPVLQVTPQSDGTVSVDVVYIPDTSREYAIDTSSWFSSFTFQVSRDEKELLTAIEYKASTTAVGQQLAATAGSTAAQSYNITSARLAAQQTLINTAAGNVDTQNSALVVAQAQLKFDQDNPLPDLGDQKKAIAADQLAIVKAQTQLSAARQALDRVRNAPQAVSGNTSTVSTGTVAPTVAPTPGTAFGQPTWNTTTIYNLPEDYGAVLYAVNDAWDTGVTKETVALKALKNTTTMEGAIDGSELIAQHQFETTKTALAIPLLTPINQSVSVKAARPVVEYTFDRPIDSLNGSATSIKSQDGSSTIDAKAGPSLSDDKKTLTIDLSKAPSPVTPTIYNVVVGFNYVTDPSGHTSSAVQQVKLEVTP